MGFAMATEFILYWTDQQILESNNKTANITVKTVQLKTVCKDDIQ